MNLRTSFKPPLNPRSRWVHIGGNYKVSARPTKMEKTVSGPTYQRELVKAKEKLRNHFGTSWQQLTRHHGNCLGEGGHCMVGEEDEPLPQATTQGGRLREESL